ncbi:MAG: YicC/YloC family endoribonuclease [Hyphomicrobiaceae bacterium]
MKSMTGFGRAEGASGNASWYFEIRSVNGRGLDVRTRLPNGSDALEPKIREALQKRIARGNVTVNLQFDKTAAAPEIRLNETALAQVTAAAERVRQITGGPPAATEGLLGLRGVLEVVEVTETDAELAARMFAMMATFESALDQFVDNRAVEGGRLAAILAAEVSEIETLVGRVSASPARKPEAIAMRLNEQIQKLLSASATFDADRLHQEAVMIATRADVEEELQRLAVHIAAARDLIAEGVPAGRKFDFLTQEFNREANTLCSKANDPEISRCGLAMKVLIDQMREQVANIE